MKAKETAPAVPEVSYHTFWERAVAYGLDGFMVILPWTLLTNFVRTASGPGSVYVILSLLTAWIWILYRVLMHGLRGQTLGKQMLRLWVVDQSEQPISLLRAALREIVPIGIEVLLDILIILNYATYVLLFDPVTYMSTPYPVWLRIGNYMPVIWILVNVLTMLANDKRRAVHDYIASTCVYRRIEVPSTQSKKVHSPGTKGPGRHDEGRRYIVGGTIMSGGITALWILVAGSLFSTGAYQEVSAPIQILLAGMWGAVAGWIIHRIVLAFHGKESAVTHNPVVALIWAAFVIMGSMLMCGALVVAWMGSGG